MLAKSTIHFNMQFYNTYVIVERIGVFNVDSKIAKETLKVIADHFKGKEFVIITNRKENYTLNAESYSPSLFKKVKGIAIVSANPDMKTQALLEQLNFNNSFAFFNNLEDAQDWAESFSYSH